MATNSARGPLASSHTIHIEHSGGNFPLRQIKTATVTDNATGEIIVNGGGVMGATFAEGGYSISMEGHRQVRVPNEVNWVSLRNTKEEITLSFQDAGANAFGTRHRLLRCQVTKVDQSFANDGNQTFTVELLSHEQKETQPEADA
jgi:hypothetical protein